MPKMDSLTHFPSKNIYNDVLCINISKVTALNVFQILIVSCALNWLKTKITQGLPKLLVLKSFKLKLVEHCAMLIRVDFKMIDFYKECDPVVIKLIKSRTTFDKILFMVSHLEAQRDYPFFLVIDWNFHIDKDNYKWNDKCFTAPSTE